MWGFCVRTTVKVGTMKHCGLLNPCHLMKPVSVTRVSGRFLTHQKGLPTLPVPPLQQTCERYLSALEPILEDEELQHTKELLGDFQKPGGVGERLQRALEKRAGSRDNWLSDWWVLSAYLDYRRPVVIHSSPGLVLPHMNFSDKWSQMRFAARLIAGVLDFKTMIDNETLPVEYLGGQPLCMDQYYKVLSSCRIPGLERDSVVNHAMSTTTPEHITVVHNCQFFVLDVYNSDGSPLSADQLYVQLERICSSSQDNSQEAVGILTTLPRDSWGRTYAKLTEDLTNKESLREIQRSIFTVCLDGATPPEPDVTRRTSAAIQMLHGGGSRRNSANRWFDKTLQFIIGEDGTCGANYEHAPAEGPPIVTLIDHVVEYTRKNPDSGQSPTVPLPLPKKLSFKITPEIKKDIEEAKEHLNELVEDLEMRVILFEHFGKNFPKSQKMSPDAFIQVALQLAYYRLHRRCCSTYESASLRLFRLGRTDTIRSASGASAAFVKAFDEPTKQNAEKVCLMEKAVTFHRSYSDMAVGGQAVDRHLFGLKMQAAEDRIPLPDIYTDASFSTAFHFRLSTSQVPSKTDCVMCFGPVVPDGYGVCYNPMNDHINFAVSAFKTCQETNASQLADAIRDALLDMKTLLVQSPRAKL